MENTNKIQTKVVNLFAGPGAGKSTTAAGLFYKMKQSGINCELVTEFAKELVWENGTVHPMDQIYILGVQTYRMRRLLGKVEYIITDSPIYLNSTYNSVYDKDAYVKLGQSIMSHFDNINIFLKRIKPYSAVGRFQTEDEAHEIDAKILQALSLHDVDYDIIEANSDAVDKILKKLQTSKKP